MYAYFDIGGTKTRVAVSEDGVSFSDPVKFDTIEQFDDEISTIASTASELAGGVPITIAGGGIAGPLNEEKTGLVNAPNVPSDWVGQSLTGKLGEALNAPIFLENDADLVGLGEAHYGAGKGDDIMVYITVSTGIGGARFVHGKIDQNVYGFEPGHQIMDFDKSACPECKGNVAEDYCSGTATRHRFGKKAYEVDDPEVWEQLSKWLAYMLNNTIVHWSPNSVVLGGSMIVGDPAIPVERVQHHLKDICKIFPVLPEIKKATLADMGGIYGAMAFVNQNIAQ